MLVSSRILAAASLLGLAAAQVSTDCNPTKDDNCPADPAFGADHIWHFNTTPSYELWEPTAGSVKYDPINYGQFIVGKQGDSPTIRTKFYFFFGRVEIWLKAASGQGIVSSTMMLSDDLDEVDWEFLGYDNVNATTNYFGKGRNDYNNGGNHPMAGGMQDDFHNYTTVWTKEQIQWFIDGNLVRTLLPNEANNTKNYPQTPMRLSLGIWAGGDPTLPQGTRQWAGGDTNYDAGPYMMQVKSVQITDYSFGKEYVWGDDSGSWPSIKVVEGNSTAVTALNRPPVQPKKSVAQKWAELPSSTKIGIYAGAGGAAGLLLGALLIYCCRQRRVGAKEARAAAEKERNERMEMEKFKRDPDSFSYHDNDSGAGSIRNNSMLNNTEYKVPEMTGPLDSKGWNGTGAAPTLSPTSPNAPAAARTGTIGGFDFGVPPSSPGAMRSSSPGMPENMRRESIPPTAFQRQSSLGRP